MATSLRKISYKLFGGETSERMLAKRIKIFVLLGIIFIALSKLLYLCGITFPNFELIIPTLVVVGSFSLYCGSTRFLREVTRYFGLIALLSVFIIDIVFWGVLPIYIFTWPGLIFCWILGLRNKLSMFDKFKTLLGRTMLTAAIAIIIFDIWTGLIGHTITTGTSLWAAFIGQVPFTLYHLASLIFIPPLVGLGKLLARIKIATPVAVQTKIEVKSSEWR
jgi:low affinity Fe/Cu permease